MFVSSGKQVTELVIRMDQPHAWRGCGGCVFVKSQDNANVPCLFTCYLRIVHNMKQDKCFYFHHHI